MEKSYDAQAALQPEGQSQEGVMQPEGGEKQEVRPEDQAYITGLMKLLHGKETSTMVQDMLKAGPPEQTIPPTALQVIDQMDQAVGQKPSLETSLAGGIYVIQDLIEIGNAGGFFEVSDEEQIKGIYQKTMQTFIQKGLKDGSIDPVELQQKVEPLMDEEHRATGMAVGEATGIPKEQTQDTAMAAYGHQQMRAGMMKGGK